MSEPNERNVRGVRGRDLVQGGYNGNPEPIEIVPGETIERSNNGAAPPVPRNVARPTSAPPPKNEEK